MVVLFRKFLRDILHQNEEINQGGKHGLKRHSSEKSEGNLRMRVKRNPGQTLRKRPQQPSPDWSGPVTPGEVLPKLESTRTSKALNVMA